MTEPDVDPFFIDPDEWFAVLCHGFSVDQQGRFDIRQVFNQVKLEVPPSEIGLPPHAHVQAFLVVGWSRGLGSFTAKVALEDTDGHVLWTWEQEPRFALGPGERAGAVFVVQIDRWFTEAGVYYFSITRSPGGGPPRRVAFEVTPTPRTVGPAAGESEPSQ